jgi:hypothetical protein
MRQVFEEPPERARSAAATFGPAVSWLRSSARPDAAAGRRLINGLYARFRDDSGRMINDLRSEDDRRFFSALDELFVHDLLVRRYRVGYEEGDTTKPDFRLYSGDTLVGSVEVLTLLLRDDWTGEQRRHAQLADMINERLSLTTHSLMVDIGRWDGSPSVRHIVRRLDESMAELRTAPDALPLDDTGNPFLRYTSRAADIKFRFLPLPIGYRVAEGDMIVVGGASTGGLIDSAARLRDRLDDKAGKYQLHSKPFAVVVGARDSWCTLDEIHRALTGTTAVRVDTGEGVRLGDGFFGVGRDHPHGKHRQVSAVYSLHDWFPGGPYQPRMTRFDNPLADAAFPHEALPFGGHWGVQQRHAHGVRADWLTAAQGLIPGAPGTSVTPAGSIS